MQRPSRRKASRSASPAWWRRSRRRPACGRRRAQTGPAAQDGAPVPAHVRRRADHRMLLPLSRIPPRHPRRAAESAHLRAGGRLLKTASPTPGAAPTDRVSRGGPSSAHRNRRSRVRRGEVTVPDCPTPRSRLDSSEKSPFAEWRNGGHCRPSTEERKQAATFLPVRTAHPTDVVQQPRRMSHDPLDFRRRCRRALRRRLRRCRRCRPGGTLDHGAGRRPAAAGTRPRARCSRRCRRPASSPTCR